MSKQEANILDKRDREGIAFASIIYKYSVTLVDNAFTRGTCRQTTRSMSSYIGSDSKKLDESAVYQSRYSHQKSRPSNAANQRPNLRSGRQKRYQLMGKHSSSKEEVIRNILETRSNNGVGIVARRRQPRRQRLLDSMRASSNLLASLAFAAALTGKSV